MIFKFGDYLNLCQANDYTSHLYIPVPKGLKNNKEKHMQDKYARGRKNCS